MTTNKYYALWYHSYTFGARSTHVISEKPETLLQQHINHIKNPNSFWHNLKKNVNELKVGPIECYTLNNNKLEPYNDSHIKNDCAFYAVSSYIDDQIYKDIIIKITYSDGITILDANDYDNLDKGEILIYLSKSDYNKWKECRELYQKSDDCIMDPELPRFFYTNWTSHDPILPDVYYDDGLMNA
jgi:hypothetical protein